jgi:hypothetical protein
VFSCTHVEFLPSCNHVEINENFLRRCFYGEEVGNVFRGNIMNLIAFYILYFNRLAKELELVTKLLLQMM